MSKDTERTRTPNDKICQRSRGTLAILTPGIAALGEKAVQRLVQTIAVFDDFCIADDPNSKHDFGAFVFDGVSVIFNIDQYPQSPSVPAEASHRIVHERVIILMLAEE